MATFLKRASITLLSISGLCFAGMLYELRTVWTWVIAPTIGLTEQPLRRDASIDYVTPKANNAPPFTRSVGETRFRGSTGYIASAIFEDEDQQSRIVHSEGLFAFPEKGREVTLVYKIRPPRPSQQAPTNDNPIDTDGALLTFDILYGRALMYFFLGMVPMILLMGMRYFVGSIGRQFGDDQ